MYSARLRSASRLALSSISKQTPRKWITRPSWSRNGSARVENHRYSPSARRSRCLTENELPLWTPCDQLLTVSSRSSGWIRSAQPRRRTSLIERPVYSPHLWFRYHGTPSGVVAHMRIGKASSKLPTRTSLTGIAAATSSAPPAIAAWSRLRLSVASGFTSVMAAPPVGPRPQPFARLLRPRRVASSALLDSRDPRCRQTFRLDRTRLCHFLVRTVHLTGPGLSD